MINRSFLALVFRVVISTSLVLFEVHADEIFQKQRMEMLEVIKEGMKESAAMTGIDKLHAGVEKALDTVPRHEFVPPEYLTFAYENRPLPIGLGQTISQPYIVALMTELLSISDSAKVLEIGTGSGYQAAILGSIAQEVYTIEIIDELANLAKARLQQLHYDNIQTKSGDGYFGWPDQAPFDAIIVTAAASHIPPPLIQQLKTGGRMVIPVGDRFNVQQLVLIEKNPGNKIKTRQILPVAFVPLTGEHP
jgi:protein-L-isoaspartate(D-aspartate) O-methyltransferase